MLVGKDANMQNILYKSNIFYQLIHYRTLFLKELTLQ
jgi:hypothetical protein